MGWLIALVAVLVIVGGVGFAVSKVDFGSEEETAATGTDATTTTAVPLPPVADLCSESAGGPRAGHPAPQPDQPGQHALLVRHQLTQGNLDLAPQGGYVVGSTPESDAKTVFVVCAKDADAVPGGEECYFGDSLFPNPMAPPTYTVQKVLRTVNLRVIEVASGNEVGQATIAATDQPCPDQAPIAELQTGVVTVGDVSEEQLVDWMRQNLAGARYGG